MLYKKQLKLYLLSVFFCFSVIIGSSVRLSDISIAGVYLTLFRVMIPLFFVIAVCFSELRYRRIFPPNQLNRYYWLFFLWIAYGAVLLLMSPYSRSTSSLKEFSGLLLAFFVMYVVTVMADTPLKVKSLLSAIKFIYIIILIVAIIEMFTGLHFEGRKLVSENPLTLANIFNPSLWPKNNNYLSTSIFYNQNDLSAFLAIFSPLFMFADEKKRMKRVLEYFTVIAAILVLSLNDANISILSVILGLILAMTLMTRNWKRWVSIFVLLILLQAYFAPVAIRGMDQYRSKQVSDSLRWVESVDLDLDQIKSSSQGEMNIATPDQTYKSLAGASKDQLAEIQKNRGSVYTRLDMSFEGFAAVIKSGLLGFGPGSHSIYFAEHPSRSGLLDPHNYWVEILFEYGIIIFLAYVFVYYSSLRRLWLVIKHKTDSEEKKICQMLLLSLFIMIFASIAPSSFLTYSYPWLLHGLSFAAINVFLQKS